MLFYIAWSRDGIVFKKGVIYLPFPPSPRKFCYEKFQAYRKGGKNVHKTSIQPPSGFDAQHFVLIALLHICSFICPSTHPSTHRIVLSHFKVNCKDQLPHPPNTLARVSLTRSSIIVYGFFKRKFTHSEMHKC